VLRDEPLFEQVPARDLDLAPRLVNAAAIARRRCSVAALPAGEPRTLSIFTASVIWAGSIFFS
jgi:hypothetical protein